MLWGQQRSTGGKIMESIWQWGIELIQAVQTIHGPALDTFFKIITFMGEEEFFLILLPFFLWCVDFTIGARLATMFLLSSYINVGFKDLFAYPRPYELEPSLQLHSASGYGLPSGHSQAAVVVWGVVAAEFRKRWWWVVSILLMILIGFSRIYLGVHFPTDVFVGWAIGLLILWLYIRWERDVEAWLKRMPMRGQLALAIGLPIALWLLHLTSDTTSSTGVLLGLGIGAVVTQQHGVFSAEGPIWQRVVRFVVGGIGVALIYYGLKMVFPDHGEALYLPFRFVRYVLVGLWAGVAAPWLFVRLRLAAPLRR